MKYLISIFFFLLINNQVIAKENIMILKLKDGDVKIELFPDVAPKHVERIKTLANDGIAAEIINKIMAVRVINRYCLLCFHYHLKIPVNY